MTLAALLLVALTAGCAAPPAAAPGAEPEAAAATSERVTGEPGAGPAASTARAAADPAAVDAAAVRRALGRALPWLEREGVAWMEGRNPLQDGRPCVSCHHVGYAVWSHAEARRAGVAIPGQAIAALTEEAVHFLAGPETRAMSAGPLLLAEPAAAAPLAAHLVEHQGRAGRWAARGQFPTQRRPVAESDAVATMYAVLALGGAGADDGAAPPAETVDTARARALAALAAGEPGTSTEWLAARLLLATAAGGDGVEALAGELAARQRADGGWGWSEGDPSDAFSTGQAVYALARTRPAAAGPTATTVERGVFYLLASQGEDGSWRVPSTAISNKPSPGKDEIYRFWGTAWAVIGLARSLPSAEPGPTPAATAASG